ncbi:MAG: SDR family oxidoreductase [Tepidimonas sp.]|nr:SDR family oxidoreductase [Tepidimonas sp.]
MLTEWAGRTAVITGAGSGLGRELARQCAARAMNLVLVDVQDDALQAAAAEAKQAGAAVLACKVDVAQADAMEALAAQIQQRFGAPHLVCNNAGVAAGGLVWENTVADWQWVLGVNLWGVIHGVRLLVPMMLQAAQADASWRGHIVNTASMAGLLTPPNMGVYNVSKHAVVALTETLYQDVRLLTDQIGVSVLCPYFVPTGIAHSERNRPAALAAGTPTRSQLIGRAMSEKAVSAARVTAAEVAQRVLEAVEHDRFYIFSHPEALAPVEQRMRAIVSGGCPPDPFAQRPEVGAQLRAALRSGG